MKLNEIKREKPVDERGFLTDPKDIKSALVALKLNIDRANIQPDGTVDYVGTIEINGKKVRQENKMKKLPIKFGTVTGSFYCNGHALTTLEGCPEVINTVFNVSGNNLTSLEYVPKRAYAIYALNNPIKSLVGIQNHINYASDIRISLEDVNCEVEEGGLGLLLIDGIKEFGNFNIKTNKSPWKIIHSYLNGSDSIFECQAELIEHGFERYAQI